MNTVLTWISNPDIVKVESFINNLPVDINEDINVEPLDCGLFRYSATIPISQITSQLRASLSDIAAQPLDISVSLTGRETINDIKGLTSIVESVISNVLGIEVTVTLTLFDNMLLYQVYFNDDLYYVHEEERKYIIEHINLEKYIGYRLVTKHPLGIYNAIKYSNKVKVVDNLILCECRYNDITQDIVDRFTYDIDKLQRDGYIAIEFNGDNDVDSRQVIRSIAFKYNVTFLATTQTFDFYVGNQTFDFLQDINQIIMRNQIKIRPK